MSQEAIFTRYDRCRSCGASIVWGVTPGGQRIPLDSMPVRNLYVRVTHTEELAPIHHAHRSHFETCPQAAAWSGSSRRRRR